MRWTSTLTLPTPATAEAEGSRRSYLSWSAGPPRGWGSPRQAEPLLEQALELSRAQNALGWELKTAITLADLWIEQGRHAEAHALVARVYGAFTEGFSTGDLIAARRLLALRAP